MTLGIDWQMTTGSTARDLGHSVCATRDGAYAMAGCFGLSTRVVKVADDGRILWSRSYDLDGASCAAAVRETGDGGLVLTGWVESRPGMRKDFFLLKTDAEGSPQWTEVYGGPGEEYAEAVEVLPDGGFAATGIRHTNGVDGHQMLVIRTDAAGTLLWEGEYGGTGDKWGASIHLSDDFGYAVAGNTEEGVNVDGILIKLERDPLFVPFLRGDANNDGRVDVADAIWIIEWLFRFGPSSVCLTSADLNDSGDVDLSDAVYCIRYRLFGDDAPAAPFPDCGIDGTPDELTCEGVTSCP